MSKQNAAVVLRIEEVPAAIRKKPVVKLTKADRKVIAGVLFIKEIVQEGYRKLSKTTVEILRQKRAEGYCAGWVYCLNYSGKHYMCNACKQKKANPMYRRHMSKYGQIRQIEREKARHAG